MAELLQQVRLIDPTSETDQLADVLISDGEIQAVATHISEINSDTKIKDCQGLVLGPGLVDLYSHSGEPGFEERETLLSFLQAAAAGGFTRVSILPDTSPSIDNPALVAQLQKHRKVKESLYSTPLLQIWGAITLDVAGKQMTELADLAAAGVVGFSDGCRYTGMT